MSYITGSHAFKVGFNNAWGYHDNKTFSPESLIPGFGLVQGVQYQFTNGVPTAIVLRSHPRTAKVEVDNDLGLFVQDKWTTGRWTLAGGLRYDWYQNSFPEQSFGWHELPERISNLSWNDMTPKLGSDLGRHGRRPHGREGHAQQIPDRPRHVGPVRQRHHVGTGPVNRLAHDHEPRRGPTPTATSCPTATSTRSAANGECGPLADPFFNTIQGGNDYDPDLLTGWNKRNYNWEFSAGVQHELAPRVSTRRLLLPPVVRQLPGLGRPCDDARRATTWLISRCLSIPACRTAAGTRCRCTTSSPATAPLSNINYLAPDGTKSETWQGLDVTGNVRLQNGLTLQGGVSGGYRVRDDCELAATSPEILHEFIWLGPTRGFFFAARPLELCRREDPWQTQVKALGAYVIPRIDVQISATFQSLPGPIVEANYNSFSSGDLGRPWSIGPFRTIQIIPNGEVTGIG